MDFGSRLDAIEKLLVAHLEVDRGIAFKGAHWHLKKEVTVAHILSSFGIIAIGIGSWFSLTSAVEALDTRTVTITEARVSGVESDVKNLDGYMREHLGGINISLIAINRKLDVLEERTVENRR
jgi:hypothetical protein